MYNTYDKATIYVKDSMKNLILIGLMLFLALSLLDGYFTSSMNLLKGLELEHIVYSLFILSELPILINYFYFSISKFSALLLKW